MKYRSRICYTETDKALMWDRWQKGDSLHSIARLFNRSHGSISGILARTGGIRPPERRQSVEKLTATVAAEIIGPVMPSKPHGIDRTEQRDVEDRAVPGHWEGDLIMGSNNSQIATLVERYTRYVMLVRVKGKDTKTVINALIKHAHKLPRELYKSLTWDRGKEVADHQRFTLATDVKVYFCDPQSPWQRGSNENTNGLLRQYFPKGMDLSNVHQNRLNAVARRLNERPRETLQFYSPTEKFSECVASTG